MRQRGFTVIELLVVTIFILAGGALFFIQKNNLEIADRDWQRKTAINAMYYSLEENFYAKNAFYPQQISDKNLTSMDPSLFTDPNGIKIGQTTITVEDQEYIVQSDYRYEPTNCSNDICKNYTLRADLENEADYIKTSRNN